MRRPFISRTPAGSGANPRLFAAPGLSPGTGSRAAGDFYINPFISEHIPILWDALLREFGRDAEYWPQNQSSFAVYVPLVWVEGVEGEEKSPGRYSHALVRNADFPPDGPTLGDAVVHAGVEYDVVRVDAFPFGHSRIVLQDRTEVF